MFWCKPTSTLYYLLAASTAAQISASTEPILLLSVEGFIPFFLFFSWLLCFLEAKFYYARHNELIKRLAVKWSPWSLKKILPPCKYGKSFTLGYVRYATS